MIGCRTSLAWQGLSVVAVRRNVFVVAPAISDTLVDVNGSFLTIFQGIAKSWI
jgi:hypothetical protein